MVNLNAGGKKPAGEDVLFAIGLGMFQTRTNLSTVHGPLSDHMVSKLRSLGYPVVGVDEFYTSKKCPSCQDFVGQVNIRRLYCPKCRKMFPGDVTAAENIAIAAKVWLVDFQRPEYLEKASVSNVIRKRRQASP